MQSDSSAALKHSFYGAAPVAQGAALTAQLTTVTAADTAGASPDYAMGTITTTSAAGFASIQECISFIYVVRNLQLRLAEVEVRLENLGLIASN